MKEKWKPVVNFEERYEVSDHGRVRSVPFKQRYILRNGREAYRLTSSKIISQRKNNSGYLLVHLYLDNVRTTKTVHALVAVAFVPQTAPEVNHIDGDKAHNHARNLEWVSRTANHLHAVAIGLNRQAVKVKDPVFGIVYDSIAQAAKAARKSHRTVRATFERVAL